MSKRFTDVIPKNWPLSCHKFQIGRRDFMGWCNYIKRSINNGYAVMSCCGSCKHNPKNSGNDEQDE